MAIDKIQSESINLADTFAFTGTVTGAGGVNTPMFSARLGSNSSSISQNTTTKVVCATEEFDMPIACKIFSLSICSKTCSHSCYYY